MEISLIEIWHEMTMAARIVAVVLMIMSVLMLAVAVERLITYQLAKGQSKRFAALSASLLQQRDLGGVSGAAKEKRFKHAYLARIVNTGILDFRDLQETAGDTSDLSTVRSAMGRSVEQESVSLRRWLSILATIGATAPFVGLLGTVLGIIGTFQKMATEGSSLEAVGVNLAEALVETAFGLFVAIPAVWLYNYFNGRVENFVIEMGHNASEMVDYFFKNRTHLDGSTG
jgi:biopolymer transport protein ExbB/biopolymer transport protein TolQ